VKLITKTLSLIGLTWMVFLGLTYAHVVRDSLYAYIALTVFFSLLTCWSIYWFVIKRIKMLNLLVTKINTSDTATQYRYIEHIEIDGNDEISSLAQKINIIIDSVQKTWQAVEQHNEQRLQDLQNSNRSLQRKIIERKAIEKKLASHREGLTQLAHYDNLTGLPNRIFFNEILNKSISHAKRHKRILAILIINLDSFSTINTTLGHIVGDQVLKEMAARFSNALRGEDILARLDGDEFIILLNDIGKPKFASTVASKLLNACALPLTSNSQLSLTASIGICVYPNDGTSLETLLQNLNTALDAAKRAGGHDYQFYTKEMDIEAREYIQLDDALRKALLNNDLVLHYQPKLHIKRGNIMGVEALIRWPHPQYGFINPSKFISLAEETGLIMPIGEWALYEACKTNKQWQDDGYEHISVGVNLSPKQFYHPDIANVISKVLNDTGLNPSYLEVEITETTVMDNMDMAASILDKIKATGVKISIDHFGTGYTSISHLKQFPVSVVKIDSSFIKGIPNIPNDVAITNAFIALAHNLGLEVVAEGVETAEQVQHLSSQNCDMVQGYFLSHPLPAKKITLQFKKLRDEVLI
jgi:diguanylate cyclase (GGDEF)-like protein